MFRGEFIRADGLVIPNNVMTYGIRTILKAALWGETPTFFMALANCNPDPDLLASDLGEPSFFNGYERQEIPQSEAGWPVFSQLNGETYFETPYFTWQADGGLFTAPINRMAIVNHETTREGAIVVALSGAFPAEVTIGPDTPEIDRKFKYRLYAR